MPLVECLECGAQISSDALACPSCGKPCTKAQNKEKDSKQGIGCVIMIVALLSALVLPLIVSGIIFVIGLILLVLNTRFS